jgi:hypothetical protein
LDGQPLWESTSVPGEGAGSPAASADGRFFAITHNLNQAGYFSIFDTASTSTAPMYQYQSNLLVFNTTTPFSAVGVYHNPLEGYYDSTDNNGRSNSNDIFVFMTDTNTDVLNAVGDPQAGSGQIYVFQFPVDFFVNQDESSLAVIPVGTIRNFQGKTAPVLADGGRTMYWNMVRGEFRGWVEQRFSRGQSGTLNLGRGSPAYIAGRASPTLSGSGTSSDTLDYSIFGPGAGNLVFKTDRQLLNTTTVTTDGIVSSRVAVSYDDMYVAYGTHSGTLVLATSSDLAPKWTVSSLNPIKGDIAMDDTRIYVGGDQGTGVGQLTAFEMAYLDAVPSSQPTMAPIISSGSPAPTQNELIGTPAPSVPSAVETMAPTRSSNSTDTSKAQSMLSTVHSFLLTVFLGAMVVLV